VANVTLESLKVHGSICPLHTIPAFTCTCWKLRKILLRPTGTILGSSIYEGFVIYSSATVFLLYPFDLGFIIYNLLCVRVIGKFLLLRHEFKVQEDKGMISYKHILLVHFRVMQHTVYIVTSRFF
jgi:hypothetical protein